MGRLEHIYLISTERPWGKLTKRKSGKTNWTGSIFWWGGYSFKSQEQSYQLALWGSDAGKLPLEKIQIGDSVAVPRTLAGETRLFRMCQADSQLMDLFEFAKEFLQKQAETNPQIGPPFRFGMVTPAGFKRFEHR